MTLVETGLWKETILQQAENVFRIITSSCDLLANGSESAGIKQKLSSIPLSLYLLFGTGLTVKLALDVSYTNDL